MKQTTSLNVSIEIPAYPSGTAVPRLNWLLTYS